MSKRPACSHMKANYRCELLEQHEHSSTFEMLETRRRQLKYPIVCDMFTSVVADGIVLASVMLYSDRTNQLVDKRTFNWFALVTIISSCKRLHAFATHVRNFRSPCIRSLLAIVWRDLCTSKSFPVWLMQSHLISESSFTTFGDREANWNNIFVGRKHVAWWMLLL